MRTWFNSVLAVLMLFTFSTMAAPKSIDEMSMAIGTGDINLFTKVLPQLKNIDEPFNAIDETPLTLAAYNGRYEMVEALLKRGANVNHQTKNGYSALIFAAMVTHKNMDNALKTVRLLLAAGANKSLRNSEGKTAYDIAAGKNATELTSLLKP